MAVFFEEPGIIRISATYLEPWQLVGFHLGSYKQRAISITDLKILKGYALGIAQNKYANPGQKQIQECRPVGL